MRPTEQPQNSTKLIDLTNTYGDHYSGTVEFLDIFPHVCGTPIRAALPISSIHFLPYYQCTINVTAKMFKMT